MNRDLYVVAVLNAKPDEADGLRELLKDAHRTFLKETGCKSYVIHEDTEQPGRFVTYETWRDEASLKAHLTSPLMEAARPQLARFLARSMELYRLGAPLRS